MPAREVCGLAREVLDVLGAAHDKGIVHRDIKPEKSRERNDDFPIRGVRLHQAVGLLNFVEAKNPHRLCLVATRRDAFDDGLG